MTIHVSKKSADYWACDTLGEIYDRNLILSLIPCPDLAIRQVSFF